jgi:transposase
MKLHANAPLGPKGRAVMARRVIEDGLTLTEAAEAAGVSVRTAGKWARRYRAEGEAGLIDRSSAPRTVHNATPPDRVEAIAALRRLRLTGPEIAEGLEMATSTVSAVLKRIGLGKLSRLEPPEPVRRYERTRPGELIHIDVKKLGRIGPTGQGAGSPVAGHGGPRPRSTRMGSTGAGSAGSAFTSASMTPPASPTSRFSQMRRRAPRSASPRLPAAGDQAHPHQALPAPDQRQGRALHPHDAASGLRRRLRQLA